MATPIQTDAEELEGRRRYLEWKRRVLPGLVALQRALAAGHSYAEVAGPAARRETLRDER